MRRTFDFGIVTLAGALLLCALSLVKAQKATEPVIIGEKAVPISFSRVGNVLTVYRGETETINDSIKIARYDTVKTPCSSDTVTVDWYETAKWWYIVKGKSVKNIYGVHTPNSGFTIGRTKRGGKWIKTEYAIDDKAGTHAIYNVMMGDSIDPGYSVASKAPSIAFNLAKDTTARQPDTVSLKNEWNMETVADSAGSNNGTLENSAELSDGGIYGKYLNLSANTKYMNCGNVAAINAKDKITVCGWFKMADKTATQRLFRKTNAAEDTAFQVITVSSTIRLYSSTRIPATAQYQSVSTDALTNNVWFHLAVVYDGSLTGNANRSKLYLNGILQTLGETGSPTIPATSLDFSSDFTLGFSSNSLVGGIDEVKIYNRALTANDVRTIYSATVQRYRSIDTCTGFAYNDTTERKQEIDTTFYFSPGSDTIISLMSGGVLANIKSILPAGAVAYDTTIGTDTAFVDSIYTVNARDTVYAFAANNIGRSGPVEHYVWVSYSDTTAFDTILFSTNYDTLYRDTAESTRDTVGKKVYIFYADSQQIDSLFMFDGVSDTTLNWLVNYRDSIYVDTLFLAEDGRPGIYKQPANQKRVYRRGVYKQPVWHNREDLE